MGRNPLVIVVVTKLFLVYWKLQPIGGQYYVYERGEISVNFFIFSQNLKINIPHDHDLWIICTFSTMSTTYVIIYREESILLLCIVVESRMM